MNNTARIKFQIIPQLAQIFQANQLLPGLSAGVVNGVLSIVLQISFAVMIFAIAFHRFIASVLGEKLTQAGHTIRALQN